MDINDIRNSRLPNRIDRQMFNDISKSARNRNTKSIPHFVENRRTKTSLAERDLKSHEFREESFNTILYQNQISSKKSNFQNDKSLVPSVVVRRKPEDKAKNNDRISLDRQNLTSCPILDNDENIRLLNYQHNFISQIQHMDRLRRLILLDLYDNRIEKICGLDNLKSLRVLMLGRNKIGKIEGLESLLRLDVLDLHANCLQTIENIDHLSELRVLNLAGNNISCLTNLHGLLSLSEINMRRNCIDTVVRVNSVSCPNLQRIFLSYNNISKISDLSCLVDLTSLNELSIDNNPICTNSNFRLAFISNLPQLELLDLKSISEDDRNRAKQIINRLDSGLKLNFGLSRHLNSNNSRLPNNCQQSASSQRFHSLKERRKSHVNNPQRSLENWNEYGKNAPSRLSIKCFSNSSSPMYMIDSSITSSPSNETEQDTVPKSIRHNKAISESNNSASKDGGLIVEDAIIKSTQQSGSPQTSYKKPLTNTRPSSSSSAQSKSDPSRLSAQPDGYQMENKDSIPGQRNSPPPESKNDIEIFNENEQIQFYTSCALKIFDDKEFWISRSGLSTTISVLIFQQIDFNEIEKNFFQIKSRFPSLKKMVFQQCHIKCYTQINSIASLKRLEELTIETLDNPIMSFILVRYYIIFRLGHLGLKKFNDTEITDQEYVTSRRYFFQMAIIDPSKILQFHLTGVISDIRKRELLLSCANDQSVPLTIHNSNVAQVPSVNVDLIAKSGLLTNNLNTDCQEHSEDPYDNLSSVLVDEIRDRVEKRIQWERKFHEQYQSAIWQLIFNRLSPMLSDRHQYMKQQFHKVIDKPAAVKSNVFASSNKK